jgi:hypothetical protein
LCTVAAVVGPQIRDRARTADETYDGAPTTERDRRRTDDHVGDGSAEQEERLPHPPRRQRRLGVSGGPSETYRHPAPTTESGGDRVARLMDEHSDDHTDEQERQEGQHRKLSRQPLRPTLTCEWSVFRVSGL